MVAFEKNYSLSQRMTQELGSAIVCGEYEFSESLPTEADLCEKFGVSRTAVREAVKMLSAKGLIASRPRQGIRILPEEDWNIFDSDLLRWSLEGNPSLRVLKEFLQMRIAIEPEAAALGAHRRNPERIKAIATALDGMRNYADQADGGLEADIDFHVSILYSSDNRFFIRMRDFVRTALNVSIRYTNAIKDNPEGIIEDHAKVFHAIESGNPERARNAMFLLIDEALSFIEQKLAENS